MGQQDPEVAGAAAPALHRLVARQPARTAWVLALSVAGWLVLAWIALDMDHPIARLTMPASPRWSVASVLAVWCMWALMMAAMMLPSALPVILTFAHLGTRRGERARVRSFVAAYLVVWFVFSAAATAVQWGLQALGWIDPMSARVSAGLTSLLLVVAGLYQFSPLKRTCLASCRTPLVFLLGEWRAGVGGAFRMGMRHGLLCVGCCWALMVLLFVGGAMNLGWIAAVATAVAIEKIAPGGERVANVLGLALLTAGLLKFLVQSLPATG